MRSNPATPCSTASGRLKYASGCWACAKNAAVLKNRADNSFRLVVIKINDPR